MNFRISNVLASQLLIDIVKEPLSSYINLCILVMKQKELIKQLKSYGWYLKRQGSNHEIWTNGFFDEPVPRHREINEILAKKILKTAKKYPRED